MVDFKTAWWYAAFAMLMFGSGGLVAYYASTPTVAIEHNYDLFALDGGKDAEFVQWASDTDRAEPLMVVDMGTPKRRFARATTGQTYIGTVRVRHDAPPLVFIAPSPWP